MRGTNSLAVIVLIAVSFALGFVIAETRRQILIEKLENINLARRIRDSSGVSRLVLGENIEGVISFNADDESRRL